MSYHSFFVMRRISSVCTSCRINYTRRNILSQWTESRTFSTGSVKCHDNEGEHLDSLPIHSHPTQGDSLLTRNRGRRRPLSPLERVSRLLPQDSLSPEVMQLRERENLEHDAEHHPKSLKDEEVPPEASSESGEALVPPGENLLKRGEILMAELYKTNNLEFRKMFSLKPRTLLNSTWGVIPHSDILGKTAGVVLKTNRDVPILIRRPSLEEYVLHMKRGPAITYPKDAAVLLMMTDVKEGDCVLETGSGSGAMSLFLSRAVGSKGKVVSVDIREDHLKRAVSNVNYWKKSWDLWHSEKWPNNIQFHHGDLCRASPLLAGHRFNAIILDLINPHLVLPIALPHLRPGCVCTAYLANITQVVDLLEGIRCSALPLLCERIVEVPVRHWWVAPAMKSNGEYCTRKSPILEEETDNDTDKDEIHSDGDELSPHRQPAFGSLPYIARPDPEQMSHTAFLVKLRKYVP